VSDSSNGGTEDRLFLAGGQLLDMLSDPGETRSKSMKHLLLIRSKALKFSKVDGKPHNFCKELRKCFFERSSPGYHVKLKASDDVGITFNPVLRSRELDIKDTRDALLRGILSWLAIVKIAGSSICMDGGHRRYLIGATGR
jgi:hypothetical protein